MAAKGAKSHYRRLPRPWERSSDNPVVRLWLARRAAGRASWWNNCYGTRTCFKSNPKPWCMPMTNGNPGSTVCKRRMGFDFIAGYRTPAISPNGLTLRVGCVGLGRSHGRRGTGQTRVGFVPQKFPSSQHHRAVFDARFIPPPGKFSKTINRNAHYIVAIKNPRDQTGIRTILLQAFPDRWR